MRTGRFSLEEQAFIRKNAKSMKPATIARKLNRMEESVANYVAKASTVVAPTKTVKPVAKVTKTTKVVSKVAPKAKITKKVAPKAKRK